MSIGKVVVKSTPQGSAIKLHYDDEQFMEASIELEQKEIRVIAGKLRSVIRKAEIVGSLDDITKLNLRAGAYMRGKIVVKQSLSPVWPEHPEEFLMYLDDGQLARTESGEYIWQHSYYTEDANEQDEIII